jgi:hypothetical protein
MVMATNTAQAHAIARLIFDLLKSASPLPYAAKSLPVTLVLRECMLEVDGLFLAVAFIATHHGTWMALHSRIALTRHAHAVAMLHLLHRH